MLCDERLQKHQIQFKICFNSGVMDSIAFIWAQGLSNFFTTNFGWILKIFIHVNLQFL